MFKYLEGFQKRMLNNFGSDLGRNIQLHYIGIQSHVARRLSILANGKIFVLRVFRQDFAPEHRTGSDFVAAQAGPSSGKENDACTRTPALEHVEKSLPLLRLLLKRLTQFRVRALAVKWQLQPQKSEQLRAAREVSGRPRNFKQCKKPARRAHLTKETRLSERAARGSYEKPCNAHAILLEHLSLHRRHSYNTHSNSHPECLHHRIFRSSR